MVNWNVPAVEMTRALPVLRQNPSTNSRSIREFPSAFLGTGRKVKHTSLALVLGKNLISEKTSIIIVFD